MTWICYVGIEISANIQKVLLAIEVVMLAVFSITALVKTYGEQRAEPAQATSALSWFNPAHMSFSHFVQAILLMLFIYWGWDSAVSVNEETADKERTPGRAAVISTVLLVAIYTLVAIAVVAFAGVGTKGIGLDEPGQLKRRHQHSGQRCVRRARLRLVLLQGLIFMVLTSAAASTQTTILPTARTSLSMAAYKAIPKAFAKIHPRFLTPSFSTLAMGGVSIALYLGLNFVAKGNIISDSVTALGWMIAFYYGLTGFSCAWYYRTATAQQRPRPVGQGHPAVARWLILFGFLAYDIWLDWDPARRELHELVDAVLAALEYRRRLHHRCRVVHRRRGSDVISIPIYRAFFRGEVMSPSPELAELLKND